MTTQTRRTVGRYAGFGKTGKQDIPIVTLMARKNEYFNFPERQRSGDVWSMIKRQYYIDTLLRSEEEEFMMLSPIVFNEYWAPQKDGTRKLQYSVEDGRQRLTTLYLFLDGKITTFSRKGYYDNVLVDILEPPPFSARYHELDDERKQRFLNSTLPVLITKDADPRIAAERYRRRNIQMAHTRGETLRSFYPNQPTLVAESISAHPLWQPLFAEKRRKERSFVFEMGLYVLYFYLYGTLYQPRGHNQINKRNLTILASGREWGNRSVEDVTQDILGQLDLLAHVFQGIEVSAKTDAIPLYQAFQYLEKATCDFPSSQAGCLKSWFEQAKYTRIEGEEGKKSALFTDRKGNLNEYAGMSNETTQIKFWRQQKPNLLNQRGLVFRDADKMREVRDGKEREEEVRVPIDLKSGVVLTKGDQAEAEMQKERV